MLSRYRDPLRLGAALQIGFLKMCGRPLDAIQRVPVDLLKHLGNQLEIPPRPLPPCGIVLEETSDVVVSALTLWHSIPL